MNKTNWGESLRVFARMSVWIAGPIIPALITGKWLDSKFNLSPYMTGFCVAVAFLISCYGIVREAGKYIKNNK